MSVQTFEGVVEQGQIRLNGDVSLPDHTKVYIVVSDVPIRQKPYFFSPRLAHPEQIHEIKMELIEEPQDASL